MYLFATRKLDYMYSSLHWYHLSVCVPILYWECWEIVYIRLVISGTMDSRRQCVCVPTSRNKFSEIYQRTRGTKYI